MNSVERIAYYTDNVEKEAPHEIPDMKPPAAWPSSGEIQMRDVVMRYRPGLPPVLKGINLAVGGGEKIGVIGR